MHLDTVCTMVDTDAVVMYPNIVDTLSAFTIQREAERRDDPQRAGPFLDAAADAMGIGKLRVIDTGLDPVTAEREQWDDGNNTLALAPGVVVAYERNAQTNARLAGRRASRCCAIADPNWAPAAAAPAACRAPSPAMRVRRRPRECKWQRTSRVTPSLVAVSRRGKDVIASWAARSPCSTSAAKSACR